MMNIAMAYMKRHRKTILLFVVVAGIFYGVFYLYNMKTETVLYASLLSVTVLLMAGIIDFLVFYKKHMQLLELSSTITVEMNHLPVCADILEEDYQMMLQTLFDYKVILESKSNIAKREMLDYYSLWAHQIKTPIAAMKIILQAQRGAHCACKEDTVYDEKELSMELFKIEQYVDMVLSYLRMEEMGSDLRLEWYDLDDLLRQAIRKYSSMFILKKIKLNFTETGTKILTDEKWMVLVIEQLLSNALKYTNDGSISIYIEHGTNKILVIEDTGIGIWEEDLPRVFEKGFTGYNGRIDKKSTGIGLYLCKQIVENLNQRIFITSDPDVGTKVYLDLTRCDWKSY